ncbi:MAG: hypothetical protein JWN76_3402, partial [Chitinophagaceae bacterium]|nr:hypothetical protein [Chitinophagaceae bacterium]
AKIIILQNLYAPSMWAIFQMQDLLSIDGRLRREDPADERINNPANPQHYWQYRMHISLEDLLKEDDFNNQVYASVIQTGRG